MEKFKRFQIKKKTAIIGGNFGDPTGHEDDFEETNYHGLGESGGDLYSKEWNAIIYL